MAKIMIGVFMSVFVGSLLFEVLRRNNAELADRIITKLRESLTG